MIDLTNSKSQSRKAEAERNRNNNNTQRGAITGGFLSCIHLNGQSIKTEAKMALLEAEVREYDIVGVTETWLNENDSVNSTNIKGYHSAIRKDRQDRIGGGVAIFIKNNLAAEHVGDLDVPGLEAVWAVVNTGRHRILVGVIYRPPGVRAQVIGT